MTRSQATARVSDVMTRQVVEVPDDESMAGAADILRSCDVSGAPVVDRNGRCVGVISGTDFAEQESLTRISAAAAAAGLNYQLAHSDAQGLFYIEEVSAENVDNHMSMPVQTISCDADLIEAARIMHHEHIHRLIVLDGQGRPVGVISSLDLIREAFQLTE
ncbi:MAG: CBS domain-containing protein [Pirellulales bacterium]|nr:CBS domain-containing protein [Pirellulales bacterium]